jgi:methyl-accepting chemotaxis protein WspA
VKKWIQNRSLLAQLLTGGLALIFCVCALTYSETAYFLSKSDSANTLRRGVAKIDIQFLKARNAERDFLLNDLRDKDFYEQGHSKNLVAHGAMMTSVSSDLERLRGLANGRQKMLMNQVPAHAKVYEDSFLSLAAAYREKGYKDWGVEGEWRKAIHDVEQHFPKTNRDALLVDYLQLRRDEKDYLLRGELHYVEMVRTDLKKLATAIRSSHGQTSAQLLSDVDQYERLFQKYLAIQETIGRTEEAGLQGEVNRAAQQVEPLLDGISSQAVVDSDAARQMVTSGGAGIGAIGVGLSGLFCYLFARSLARPMKALTEAVASVGDGNLGTSVSFEAQNEPVMFAGGFGEIRVLARAFDRTVAALKEMVRVAERIAAGDLAVVVTPRSERDVVGHALAKMVERLSTLMGEVQQSGIEVTSSVNEIAATANEQQATAAEIAATTTEIGATSREISATSKELVRTMSDVSAGAEESATLASGGQAGLTRMEETMRHVIDAAGSINAKLAVLSEKAGNINQVVTTITRVADQTNLLSLNAAIEAEKAGEYGRGFSVVATEIRRLADQTAVATYDIEQMVKDIQSAVSAGVMGMDKFAEEVRRGMQDVQEVGGQLSQIIQHVQALAPRVESVNEGMQAQATGAEQISESLTQLSEAARQTVDSLHQSSLAINDLNQVAIGLRSGVSRFTLQARESTERTRGSESRPVM